MLYSEEGANKSGLAWPSAFKVQLQLPDNEVARIIPITIQEIRLIQKSI